MSLELAIVLYLAGLGFMFVEMFVPGGVVGVIGFGACVAGVVVAWHVEWYYGVAGLVLTAVVTPTVIIIALKRLSLKQSLTKGDAAEGPANLDALVGSEGVTTTMLRPTGFADIGGRRVNVVSRGEMIPKNAKVTVMTVEGNRVVVRKAD